MLPLDKMLEGMVEDDATELILKVGSSPFLRKGGELVAIPGADPLKPDVIREIVGMVVPDHLQKEFELRHQADFAHSLHGVGRFRVHVSQQRGTFLMIFRRVLPGTPQLKQLGLPPIVESLANERRGLIVLAGPRGSGVTSTAAALLNHINTTRKSTIVTIEHPIEVLHPDQKSLVIQREVGMDARTFHEAMDGLTGLSPDVVLVSEMPDPETAWEVLSAASTGQLVITTVRANTVLEAIMRLTGVFAAERVEPARRMLASSLQGMVVQRLVPRANGVGSVVAVEVMTGTPDVQLLIRGDADDETIEKAITTGATNGMQTMDQSLLELYEEGLVERGPVMSAASHPADVREQLDSIDASREQYPDGRPSEEEREVEAAKVAAEKAANAVPEKKLSFAETLQRQMNQ